MEKTEERKVYCLNCAYLIDGDSPLRNECGHPQRAIRDRDGLVVRPYTNEGDTVLDNCLGSGTTAVACKQTGRNCIGIEISPDYCEIARKRVEQASYQMDLL